MYLSNVLLKIETSISFCFDSIDHCSSKLQSAVEKTSIMENKIEFYEKRCDMQQKEVIFLKLLLTMLNKLFSMTELSEVPKNVSEIIKLLAQTLNCNILQNSDILDSNRGMSYQNKVPRYNHCAFQF